MPEYRLPPARMGGHLTLVLSFVALIVGVPAVITAALPDREPQMEPVEFSSEDVEFTVTPDELLCPWDPMAMAEYGWTCENVAVSYTAYSEVEDADRLLRRTLRATAIMTSLPEGEPVASGPLTALVDAHSSTVALTLTDPEAKHEGTYAITLQGPREQITTITEKVWQSATERELPPKLVKELEALPSGPEFGGVLSL